MPKPTYTPFTYLIRMESSKHLVLSASVMLVTVIRMIYGLLISPHQRRLKLFEKSTESLI